MAVRSRTELLDLIRGRLGEDTGDDALTLIEDITDTFTDLESRATDPENWHERYNQLDTEWRQRYRDRFYDDNTPPPDEPDEPETIMSFSDLFKEE